jgi:hypothetical protein
MNNGHAFGNKNRLLIGRSLFSCQYFILVFGGMVDEDAYFTHLEVEFEERFGGKLRTLSHKKNPSIKGAFFNSLVKIYSSSRLRYISH